MMEIDPTQIRRTVAKSWRKQSHGTRRTPDAVVLGMYEEYQRTGSIARAAKAFGRTEGALRAMFRLRGLRATKGPGGPHHRHPDAVAAQWYTMYRQLGTLRAVASRVGKCERAVAGVLRRHGWPISPRGRRRTKRRITPATTHAGAA